MKRLSIKNVTLKLSEWDRISHCGRNVIQQEGERFEFKYRVAELTLLNKFPVNSDMSRGLINMKFEFLVQQGRTYCLNK